MTSQAIPLILFFLFSIGCAGYAIWELAADLLTLVYGLQYRSRTGYWSLDRRLHLSTPSRPTSVVSGPPDRVLQRIQRLDATCTLPDELIMLISKDHYKKHLEECAACRQRYGMAK